MIQRKLMGKSDDTSMQRAPLNLGFEEREFQSATGDSDDGFRSALDDSSSIVEEESDTTFMPFRFAPADTEHNDDEEM